MKKAFILITLIVIAVISNAQTCITDTSILKLPVYGNDTAIVITQSIKNYRDSFVFNTRCFNSTIYGIDQQNAGYLQTLPILKASGINLVRVALYYAYDFKNGQIDNYLKSGYNVQINFNYLQTSSQVPFPTDTNFIRNQAEAFFKYYSPYKNQIPVVVVENEWDNLGYHSGTIQQYLNELRIVVEVGHKYGFKVADAGTTGTALQSWYSSKINQSDLVSYKQQYFVNTNFIAAVNEFIDGIKKIHTDYLNVHWYNLRGCAGQFPEMVKALQAVTGKQLVMTNEFGARDASQWACTINELKQVKFVYAIAYSGINAPGGAITINPTMLTNLK